MVIHLRSNIRDSQVTNELQINEIYRRTNNMDWQIDSFGSSGEASCDPDGSGPASLWPRQVAEKGRSQNHQKDGFAT